MVKRHTLIAHQTFPDLPAEVVAASDYDRLSTILRAIYDEVNTGSDVWAGSPVMRHVESALGLPEVYSEVPAADTSEALNWEKRPQP